MQTKHTIQYCCSKRFLVVYTSETTVPNTALYQKQVVYGVKLTLTVGYCSVPLFCIQTLDRKPRAFVTELKTLVTVVVNYASPQCNSTVHLSMRARACRWARDL